LRWGKRRLKSGRRGGGKGEMSETGLSKRLRWGFAFRPRKPVRWRGNLAVGRRDRNIFCGDGARAINNKEKSRTTGTRVMFDSTSLG
jgi:hypothetical protein